jgi:DNA polymerase elongation subunit (family B)
MDKLTVKRNEYKALMKSDPDNKSKWDAMQFATKSMVASLYGVSGDSKFGMYHPDIASAITFTSRQTLFRLRDECNDRGYPVVYGHTDSIFCEVATPEEGVELVAKINESMYPIETEFEKWAESMVLKAKNRYAGKVTWTDGQYHEPDYYYKGLELIQTRMPKAMKDSMGSILRGILDGDEEADVSARISEMITKGINGDFGNDLLMKGKLKQKLSSYKVLSGASAGVAWAKINLNKDYDVGDSFLTAVDKSGNTMAFDNIEELRGVAEIDWRSMTEKYIVKKACDIYELVAWDTQPLWNAFLGLNKTVWL